MELNVKIYIEALKTLKIWHFHLLSFESEGVVDVLKVKGTACVAEAS